MTTLHKTVDTSTLELAYYEWGAGDRSVLLLHGFPEDAASWDKVGERLAAQGYHAYAPYLRGFGPTRFLDADTLRSGQLAALTNDVLEFADALGLDTFTLVGHDWGARAAQAVSALYPERVEHLVSFTDYELAWDEAGFPPHEVLHALWYQWVLLSEMGEPLLRGDAKGFCKYLWKVWSPTWAGSQKAFETAASSFDNPDFVEVVLSAYRYGRAPDAVSDPELDKLEQKLAEGPNITVPTTLLIGKDDGIVRSWKGDERWRARFTGKASRQLLEGVGHFPQREHPEAVIRAVTRSLEEVSARGEPPAVALDMPSFPERRENLGAGITPCWSTRAPKCSAMASASLPSVPPVTTAQERRKTRFTRT